MGIPSKKFSYCNQIAQLIKCYCSHIAYIIHGPPDIPHGKWITQAWNFPINTGLIHNNHTRVSCLIYDTCVWRATVNYKTDESDFWWCWDVLSARRLSKYLTNPLWGSFTPHRLGGWWWLVKCCQMAFRCRVCEGKLEKFCWSAFVRVWFNFRGFKKTVEVSRFFVGNDVGDKYRICKINMKAFQLWGALSIFSKTSKSIKIFCYTFFL